MKRLFLLLLIIPFLVGCTIELSDNNSDDNDDNTNIKEEKTKNIGSSSSISSPLKIDKYGLASKYNAKTSKYVTVDVKINKKLEKSYIEKYNKEHKDDKFITPSGYKSYVIEYEVKLTNFETESFGVEPALDVEIVDEKGNDFVVSKVKQVIEVKVLDQDLGIVNNASGKVVIAFNLPSNYNNFIIKIGTKGKKQAYFKI